MNSKYKKIILKVLFKMKNLIINLFFYQMIL